jgi:hypothetical protein
MARYKAKAKAKKVSFELTVGYFEDLINGDCEYCHRSPTTWFGIDRINPDDGYVIGNVATCCFDCNVDKHKVDARATATRNNRIAERVDTGEIDIIVCPKIILNIGTQKSKNNVKS